MRKPIFGVLETFDDSQNVKAAVIWLQQFGEVRIVTFDERPSERNDLNLLVIPHGNFMDSTSPKVVNRKSLCQITHRSISGAAATFRDQVLELYIQSRTPIVALGASADMLWTHYGGKILITPHEEELITLESMLALVTDEMVESKLFDENHSASNEGLTFFQAYMANTSIWVGEVNNLTPMCWSSFMSKQQLLSQIKGYPPEMVYDILVSKTNDTVGFYDPTKLLLGLKQIPYMTKNSTTSLTFTKFKHHIGDPLANGYIQEMAKLKMTADVRR